MGQQAVTVFHQLLTVGGALDLLGNIFHLDVSFLVIPQQVQLIHGNLLMVLTGNGAYSNAPENGSRDDWIILAGEKPVRFSLRYRIRQGIIGASLA